jgi:hypothetical protein
MTSEAGLEPASSRIRADRSATELFRSHFHYAEQLEVSQFHHFYFLLSKQILVHLFQPLYYSTNIGVCGLPENQPAFRKIKAKCGLSTATP